MYSLNIQNETVYFRDIKIEHLPHILHWYNKVDDFKFATGIDEPMTLDCLKRKYAEVSISSNEFFVGIYARAEGKMVGILKGRLSYRERDSAWISSIAIDLVYQNKGFGSSSIQLLLDHLKFKCQIRDIYLAVIEENIRGVSFWNKHNFKAMRKIDNHIKLQNRFQNAIIMHRDV